MTALARTPQKFDFVEEKNRKNLTIIKGDVLDFDVTLQTIKGNDVVINCLGGNSLKGPGWDLHS